MEQTQQVVEVDPAPKPSFVEQMAAYQDFIVAIIGILTPVLAIIFGYLTVKAKTDAANRQRYREAVRKHQEEEYSDMTVMDWARKEMTRRKDDV